MIIASGSGRHVASIDSLWHYESVDEAYSVEKSDEERGIGREFRRGKRSPGQRDLSRRQMLSAHLILA